ncbi:vacuolar membrane protein-domain-containing protein [Infundibulicybe gibba]|nr:vacuolar membrane protein-domain-containing protein [Infundibulicybe gibba]
MASTEVGIRPGIGGSSITGLLEEYPDVDQRSCQLLGPTALVTTFKPPIMLPRLLTISAPTDCAGPHGSSGDTSLVYKRQREKSKRPWRIWLFDVSKQVVGQMFVHGVNVLISNLVSHHTSSNACVFYFLNILIDTTLGVALIYLVLHALTHIFSEKLHLQGFESGVYGTPPSFKYWARQAAIYVLSLTTMKLLVLALFALFPAIFKLGEWLLSWTWAGEGDGDAVQVIFTMGIFPIIMNILQFWLIDSIVKASATTSPTLDSSVPDSFDSYDREPLFGAPSDEDDDNDDIYPRHDIENPRSRSPPHRNHQQNPDSSSDDTISSGSFTPHEPKSSSSSTRGQALDTHSYPPSLSSSLTSTASPSTSPRPATKLLKKVSKRPAPLSIRPQHQPVVNSPQVTPAPTPLISASVVTAVGLIPPVKDEWADSWDDADDWAGRVGEEDWTGKRMEGRKGMVDSTWDGGVTPVGS